jgi:hypothetical protein
VRYKNGLAVLLAATAPAALQAHAQLLDAILPAAVPGYRRKFNLISQYRQLAPAATCWDVDGVSAAPRLSLQTGYDSAPGGSSPLAMLQPNASVLVADEAAGFSLYGQVAAENFLSAVIHDAVTGFDFDTAEITNPIPYTLNNLHTRDEISLGLFTMMPGKTPTFSRCSRGFRKSKAESGVSRFSQAPHITCQGFTVPVFEARADRMATMLDEIYLPASQEIDDLISISSTPHTESSIKLFISHKYLENVTIQTFADIAEAQYIQTDLREFLATGDIDLLWQASPVRAVVGIYCFNTRQADAVSAANQHILTLGLTWTP